MLPVWMSMYGVWAFSNPDMNDTMVQSPAFQQGSSLAQAYTEQGIYYVTLTVTNANGCVDTVRHPLYVIGEYVLFAPNSFTPNEDGINDYFKPQIIGVDDDEFGIYIYDRWGDLVYLYEKEYSSWQGWDGRANKKTG